MGAFDDRRPGRLARPQATLGPTMQITEVKVFPVNEDKLKAFVSIVLDGCFMINDIKVIRGKDGMFISMPSRRKKSGEFKDVAHPLNNETRRLIEEQVLVEYERLLYERGEEPEAGRRQLPSEELCVEGAEDGASPEASRPGTEEPVSAPRPPVAAHEPHPAAAEDPPAESLPLAAQAEAPAEPGAEPSSEDKSLEEIQEMHLRDSFWSVS